MKRPRVKIENVVASARLGDKINLNVIARKIPKTEYEPKQFPGLIFRIERPQATALIFKTGKIVCTGAKSEDDAVEAVRAVIRKLQAKKIKLGDSPIIDIKNIVSTINLQRRIRLERSARTLVKCMYEPEQFPGLIYRMEEPKAVFLIFSTGKMVCTGIRRMSEIYRATHLLVELLESKDLFTK